MDGGLYVPFLHGGSGCCLLKPSAKAAFNLDVRLLLNVPLLKVMA